MANRARYVLLNRTRGVVIADRVELAGSFVARARGLIGRNELPAGFALAIKPCSGVHTLFMSIPLDVGYVGRDGRIVRILHGIKPWRVGPLVLSNSWVVELRAGTLQKTGTTIGDVFELIDGDHAILNL